MKQLVLSLVCTSSFASFACGSDAPPAQPIAGGAAVPTASDGTITSPVTGAGQGAAAGVGAGVAGMSAAGVGAATAGTIATGPAIAGAGAAGTGAGAVAGSTATAGSGTTGMAGMGAGAAGMGSAMVGMGAAGGGAAFVPGSPTWSAIYEEIIVGTGCNGGTTCHTSPAAGALKMTVKADAYTALVGAKAAGVNLIMNGTPNCKDSMLTRVVAGDPASSLLIDKLTSATPKCGGKMPPSGTLEAPKVEQVRTWIMNGAKND